MTEKIVLYSNHCPKCNVLIAKLNAANIMYDEISDIQVMLMKGFNAMPILEINGESLDFMQANAWIEKRANNGH